MSDPIAEFARAHNWSPENVQLAVEAGFRCQYCGRSFLDSADAYFSFTVDHLVPQFAGGDDTVNNKVLSCRLCNVNLKSRWNPLSVLTGPVTKERLLQAARDYVQERLTEQEARVVRERHAANELLAQFASTVTPNPSVKGTGLRPAPYVERWASPSFHP